jgi:hypothetical protein
VKIPNEVSGVGLERTWLGRLLAFLRSVRLLPGRGYRVKRGLGGTVIEVVSDL